MLAAPGAARAAAAGGEGSTTRAYIVVDDKTGRVLSDSHSNDKVQVASLTKIATAVVVLDWVRLGGHTLDQMVSVPGSTVAADGSANPGGLQAGDEVSVRDLLYAALLQSDNIAADALAEFVGGRTRRPPPPAAGESQREASPGHGALRR